MTSAGAARTVSGAAVNLGFYVFIFLIFGLYRKSKFSKVK